MTAPHAQQIIDGYLARLDAELVGVPATRRRELLDDVRGHVSEARAGLTEETDADLLNILDRLGDPAELAAEHRRRLGIAAPVPFRPRLMEIGALVLTPLVGDHLAMGVGGLELARQAHRHSRSPGWILRRVSHRARRSPHLRLREIRRRGYVPPSRAHPADSRHCHCHPALHLADPERALPGVSPWRRQSPGRRVAA